MKTGRASASSRSRLATTQQSSPAVKLTGAQMNSDATPSRYINPGPPMKTKPLNAADIVARPVTTSPSDWPAMKKSRALRVRRAAHRPIATTSTR